MTPANLGPKETSDRLARRALFGFVLMFILSRTVVFLIMSRRIPNLFLFLQGTHVHHLIVVIVARGYIGGLVGPALHNLEAASSP